MPSDRGRLEWVGYSMVETRWSSVWYPDVLALVPPQSYGRLVWRVAPTQWSVALGGPTPNKLVERSWSMQCDIGRPEVLTEVLRARDERRRFGVALDSGSLPRIPAVASSRDLEIIIVPTLLVTAVGCSASPRNDPHRCAHWRWHSGSRFDCARLGRRPRGRGRDVAQLGSALDWGSRGRRFKSCRPDQHEAR
jgi:hypothetical protein